VTLKIPPPLTCTSNSSGWPLKWTIILATNWIRWRAPHASCWVISWNNFFL